MYVCDRWIESEEKGQFYVLHTQKKKTEQRFFSDYY